MKKLIICIFLFAVIIGVSNFLYVKLGVYEEDIIKCDAELVHKMDSFIKYSEIIYFGESSNFTYSEHDKNKKAISELIFESNRENHHEVSTINKGAIHPSTYKALISRITDNTAIKLIIVTVNLRSFGINWIESKLESNIDRANILYSNYPPIIKKFFISFKVYDNKNEFERKETIRSHYKNDQFKLLNNEFKTVREWDAFVFNMGIKDSTGKKDQMLTDVACHFIKNYAFIIDEANPRIKDLDAIVSFCKEKKISLLFHLLPENFERANLLCGNDLGFLMKTNVNFLKNRYSGKTIFIDNSILLPDTCFIDRDWPTEHYNFFGRNFIAKKIREQIKF